MIHYAVAKRADRLGIVLTENDTEVVAEKDGFRVVALTAKEALDFLVAHLATDTPSHGQEDDATKAQPASAASKVHSHYKQLYGKDANCGDDMAHELKAWVVDPHTLADVARDNGIDPERWSHLNFGMQRMNLGNSLRRKLRKGEQVVVGGRTMQLEAEQVEAA